MSDEKPATTRSEFVTPKEWQSQTKRLLDLGAKLPSAQHAKSKDAKGTLLRLSGRLAADQS